MNATNCFDGAMVKKYSISFWFGQAPAELVLYVHNKATTTARRGDDVISSIYILNKNARVSIYIVRTPLFYKTLHLNIIVMAVVVGRDVLFRSQINALNGNTSQKCGQKNEAKTRVKVLATIQLSILRCAANSTTPCHHTT